MARKKGSTCSILSVLALIQQADIYLLWSVLHEESYQLNFLSPLSREHLEQIAVAAVAVDSERLVTRVYDMVRAVIGAIKLNERQAGCLK